MGLFKKEISRENKINLIVSANLIIFGLIILFFPAIANFSPVNTLYVLFALYAVLKIEEYFLTKPDHDYEELYTAIVSAVAAISGFKFVSYEPHLVLGLTLAVWVSAMAVIKLIKLDYYHDRHNGMMYINLGTMFLFLLLGLLTSVNLFYSEDIQFLMLGFFFTINGLLDLAEDTIRILVTNNVIKISDLD